MANQFICRSKEHKNLELQEFSYTLTLVTIVSSPSLAGPARDPSSVQRGVQLLSTYLQHLDTQHMQNEPQERTFPKSPVYQSRGKMQTSSVTGTSRTKMVKKFSHRKFKKVEFSPLRTSIRNLQETNLILDQEKLYLKKDFKKLLPFLGRSDHCRGRGGILRLN